jgi:hypothetical protein
MKKCILSDSIFARLLWEEPISQKDQHMSKLDKSETLQFPAMKAVIIYQDFTSAVKANGALQHSEQHSDVHVRWNIRPWRVDMLKCPPTADEALEDAMDAHLIVFAGCCTRSISHCLQDWLEKWAECRQIEAAALAIFAGENSDKLSTSAALHLSQFVKHHGLSVIFDDRGAIEDSLLNAGSLQNPKQSKSSIQVQLLDVKPRDEDWFRQWGINE